MTEGKKAMKAQRSVYISEEMWKSLRKAAVDAGVPVSTLIEEVLKGWLLMQGLGQALKEERTSGSGTSPSSEHP